MCIGLLADEICSAFIGTVSAVYSQEARLFFSFLHFAVGKWKM